MIDAERIMWTRRWVILILTVLWMGGIFALSSMHGAVEPARLPLWKLLERKGAHVFEYFILTGLLFECFRAWSLVTRRSMGVAIAGCLSLAYAFSDELHQLFVPGREGKLSDVGIDMIGIGLAGILIVGLGRKKRR